MKAKRVLLILIVLILCVTVAVSCKKKEEQETPLSFYRSASPRQALTTSVQVSLQGYSFDSFLEGGKIKVAEIDENNSANTLYGVISGRGEIILPVKYTSLKSVGSFFLAEGGEEISRHYVFSEDGRELYVSDEAIGVIDVGEGYFSVSTATASYLLNENGENVLPGTHMEPSCRYSVCGEYVLAKNEAKKETFIFHAKTSNVLLSFFDSDAKTHLVVYVGGKEFIDVFSERLESSEGADVEINRDSGVYYYKQTIRRYNAENGASVLLTPGRFIVRIDNRYTLSDVSGRESFLLEEGYNAVAYYAIEGRKASGSLNYYIADASLSVLKDLPEDVSARLNFVNGLAAAVNGSGSILLLDDKADVKLKIDDAVYQDVVFSGEVVTASKVMENGTVRRGAFDLSGKVVVPFEYSYISEFVGGKAVATKAGVAYLLSSGGEAVYIGDYTMPHYFEGFYQTTSGDMVGAASFDGKTLIPPVYFAVTEYARDGNTVYVALSVDSVTDVYRLY